MLRGSYCIFPKNVGEVILGEWAVIYSVRISETNTKW